MEAVAHIGPSVLIRGEVSAQEDVTIAGRIEGSVRLDGHVLTITAGGVITADIEAGSIVVGGCVEGNVAANERVVLRETAEIHGDITAPRVLMVDGAALRGRVEMPTMEPLLAA